LVFDLYFVALDPAECLNTHCNASDVHSTFDVVSLTGNQKRFLLIKNFLNMSNNIYPCLWFDGNAKAAADFYCSVFNNSRITTNTPMVVQFEIEGKKVMGLNGGPMFSINPSISFFVTCETDEEIERVYNKLLGGGSTLMPLDKYPWSEKYAWVTDQYGMTWQLMLGKLPEGSQKIVASFLFVGPQCGKAQDAITHYTSVFPGSAILYKETYKAGEEQPEGNLKFGQFILNGQMFAAMDGTGNHNYNFNEGVSLVVDCGSQEEIDSYWNKLTDGGEESRCGWLKDRFGVSWQIVPKELGNLMKDPARAQRVMAEVMKMNKLDLQVLENA
jgi:predicted 3-demethylubiquinone-9 3-methyltransferase (glyoxalase superfamily)